MSIFKLFSRPTLCKPQLLKRCTYSLVPTVFPPNFFAEHPMSTVPSTASGIAFPAIPYKPRYDKWPYSSSDFQRQDESNDGLFYRQPRLVTHIDDAAIERLTKYYATVLPHKGRILDLCASWNSFYPPSTATAVQRGELEVYGVGLNGEELALNNLFQKKTERWRVLDLNREPWDARAAWPDRREDLQFDAVTCVVSIDYLNAPREVCERLLSAVREGGKVHLAISNRCFPTKVVRRWMMLGEQARLEFVGDYLHFAGWKDVEIVDLCARDEKGERITDDRGTVVKESSAARVMGHLDPLWVVRATKRE